jgi:uncharacterized protein YqeY
MSSELRTKINNELKTAMKEKDDIRISTVRLITAALKDRDISSRSKGDCEGIGDDEILSLLQTMIKQRQDSIRMYTEGGRSELAARESDEITVIQKFLPEQLDEKAIQSAVSDIITETGASSVKDMGRVMGVLKDRFAGQMDFGVASQIVKGKLIAS